MTAARHRRVAHRVQTGLEGRADRKVEGSIPLSAANSSGAHCRLVAGARLLSVVEAHTLTGSIPVCSAIPAAVRQEWGISVML